MRQLKADINGFKSRRAFKSFMSEAMALESNLVRHINNNRCEMLYFFVNDETGKIVTWYRENDPAATILEAHNRVYHKIPWQIRG